MTAFQSRFAARWTASSAIACPIRVFSGTFSVTRAEVTRDLRYAKIYVSILEEADRAPMMAALKKAAGFVRHELGQSMIIRYAPEILL